MKMGYHPDIAICRLLVLTLKKFRFVQRIKHSQFRWFLVVVFNDCETIDFRLVFQESLYKIFFLLLKVNKVRFGIE